jgi:ribose/xylose/arabinose/galactoside ABC-type transport system permease subunit
LDSGDGSKGVAEVTARQGVQIVRGNPVREPPAAPDGCDLLVAEIDLSVAAGSAVCAAVFGQIAVQENISPVVAIIAALATGAAIGFINGAITTRFRVPSFIVTLGGSFILQGLLLIILPRRRNGLI